MTPRADPSTTEVDGRRRRTLASRAHIVTAMLDLTRDGEIAVTAELVADRAGVGLRTVFRHFKDMDSLYREMSLAIEASLAADLALPFARTGWRGKLDELIDRRAGVFERITPFKRAEAAQRHRSRFLEADTRRLNAHLREILHDLLPEAVTAEAQVFEALDLLLSFESWDRLRREQGLNPDQARNTLAEAIRRLMG